MNFILDVKSKRDLNGEDLIRLHKEYWNTIANPFCRSKPDIFTSDGDPAEIVSDCFLCEYAERKLTPYHSRCFHCPAQFSGTHCLGGLYDKWRNSHFLKFFYAKQIANIPIKRLVDRL